MASPVVFSRWAAEPMPTPAQKYRQALIDLSGSEREILRLEQRWKKNALKWKKAATKVQNCIRSVFARRIVAIKRAKAKVDQKKCDLVAKAIDSYRLRRMDDAPRLASGALDIDPGCFEGYRVKGHVFLATKKYNEAIAEYTKVLGLVQDSTSRDACEFNTNECRFGRSRCYSILGLWKQAQNDLVFLMGVDPENSKYCYYRGLIRSRKKLWTLAAKDFAKCVELGDSSVAMWLRRGMAEASSQMWAEAAESFSAALLQDERAVEAYCLRGRTYCCLRKWEEAELDFKKALEINPDCQEAKDGLETVNIPHLPLPLRDSPGPSSGTP